MAEREQDPVLSALKRLPRLDMSTERMAAIRTRAHAELRAATASRSKPLLRARARAMLRAGELMLATGYSLYVLGKLATLLSMH